MIQGIEWSALPVLPMRRGRDLSDRERLAHAKMRRAKGPKQHSTNKERSFMEKRKARAMTMTQDAARARLRAYHDAVRAYWRGEGAEYPLGPGA